MIVILHLSGLVTSVLEYTGDLCLEKKSDNSMTQGSREAPVKYIGLGPKFPKVIYIYLYNYAFGNFPFFKQRPIVALRVSHLYI